MLIFDLYEKTICKYKKVPKKDVLETLKLQFLDE